MVTIWKPSNLAVSTLIIRDTYHEVLWRTYIQNTYYQSLIQCLLLWFPFPGLTLESVPEVLYLSLLKPVADTSYLSHFITRRDGQPSKKYLTPLPNQSRNSPPLQIYIRESEVYLHHLAISTQITSFLVASTRLPLTAALASLSVSGIG